MNLSELEQLTLNEIEQLTPRDLELEVSEILKRYQNSELPLTPKMVEKLNKLADLLPEDGRSKLPSVKTVSDFVRLSCCIVDFLKKTGLDNKLRDAFELISQSFSDLIE